MRKMLVWALLLLPLAGMAQPVYDCYRTEGKITVDEVGLTHFVPMKGGMQYYLMTNEEQNQKILDYFLSIIPQKPKSKQ